LGDGKWTAKSRKCSSQTEKNKISRKIEKKRNGKIASSQMCPKDNAIEIGATATFFLAPTQTMYTREMASELVGEREGQRV